MKYFYNAVYKALFNNDNNKDNKNKWKCTLCCQNCGTINNIYTILYGVKILHSADQIPKRS